MKETKTRIGLVPMSAKPYHKGHHYLVTTAAAQNDKVLLFVSISDRCRKGEVPIYGSDMESIWCNQLELILPENVEVSYGGSPVRKVYETLVSEEAKYNDGIPPTSVYTVYSDEEDTRLNYTEGRSKNPSAPSPAEKYFPNLYANNLVRFAAFDYPEMFTRGQGAPDVSGTAMRNMLIDPSDKPSFMSDLPEDLDDSSKEEIYGRLKSRVNESSLISSQKRDRAILEAFLNSSKKRPEKGTVEYSEYLEKMMDELQHIKASYESRKKSGWKNRKEASRIQDAYSELKRLRNKNNKKLNAQKLNEIYNIRGYNYNIEISSNCDLSRDELKDFFKKFK